MSALDETAKLLDLLREAGDEAVTLDELEVVGVGDPGAALLALELAGHSITRVFDNRVTCFKLGPEAEVVLPEPEPFVVTQRSAPKPSPSTPLLVAAALLLLGLLLASRRR
jgi:hypothetical protein